MTTCEITVEKNVPLPANAAKRDYKYPFREMAVGDSFFVECRDKGDQYVKQNNLITLARQAKDRKFTARQTEGGVRVWRIK